MGTSGVPPAWVVVVAVAAAALALGPAGAAGRGGTRPTAGADRGPTAAGWEEAVRRARQRRQTESRGVNLGPIKAKND